MTYGTKVEAVAAPTQGYDAQAPVSMTSNWVTIISAGTGGITTVANAAALLNPEDANTSALCLPFYRKAKGTNLLLRVKYATASTVSTSPIVKVFGKSGTDAWDNLPDKSGAYTTTLTCTQATDVRDGTFNYSPINFSTLSWDCLGCEQFIVLVSTAMVGSALTTAVLQGKII